MRKKRFLKSLEQTIWDFIKKCTDDHVGPFGAMAAFFMLLSVFPFMIFTLTIARHFHYFGMEDIIHWVEGFLMFENSSFVRSIFREIYAKTGTTVPLIALVIALWSASKGAYTIIIGLNSVYDIEERRNYLVLRLVGMVYTILFGILLIAMLVFWVFGALIKRELVSRLPEVDHILSEVLQARTVYTVLLMTLMFMLIYQFVPNRKSSFTKQLPGALISTIGWMVISWICSLVVTEFTSFNYFYGSMASIMILLYWLYLCMSMVFYGAEINFFLENKKNYHELISILRPRWERQRRAKEKELWEFSYHAQKRSLSRFFTQTSTTAGEFDETFDEFGYKVYKDRSDSPSKQKEGPS